MSDSPATPPDAKPVIDRKAANWQIHVAGLQATKETEGAGIDSATAAHLLDAAAGLTIAGVTFPPITAGFLMMLPLIEGLRNRRESLSQEGGQLSALCFCLGQPEAAWQCLRQGDEGKSFEAAAFAYANQFTLRDLRRLAQWMTAQMSDLNDASQEPEPGKPQDSAASQEASQSLPSA